MSKNKKINVALLLESESLGTLDAKTVICCAEQVIGLYESKHPDDSRPRKAIDAAKAYILGSLAYADGEVPQ